MRLAISLAILAGLAAAAPALSKAADIAGEWTRCVAWNGGQTFNIVNGSWNRDRCFQLARICTGNPNVTATYYTPAVIVNAPYIRCMR